MTITKQRTPGRTICMTTGRRKDTPFDDFYKGWRGKTPANAIRLAISDHEANGRGIGDFVSALRQAERIVEADSERDKITAALLAALRMATNAWALHKLETEPWHDVARAAIAAATGEKA